MMAIDHDAVVSGTVHKIVLHRVARQCHRVILNRNGAHFLALGNGKKGLREERGRGSESGIALLLGKQFCL